MSHRETANRRAGGLVARWRETWGKWVDHWSSYCPGKTQAQVHADVPGLVTRLRLARDIADEIEAALIDHDNGWDESMARKDRKEKVMKTAKDLAKPDKVGSRASRIELQRQVVALEKEKLLLESIRIGIAKERVSLRLEEARLKAYLKATSGRRS